MKTKTVLFLCTSETPPPHFVFVTFLSPRVRLDFLSLRRRGILLIFFSTSPLFRLVLFLVLHVTRSKGILTKNEVWIKFSPYTERPTALRHCLILKSSGISWSYCCEHAAWFLLFGPDVEQMLGMHSGDWSPFKFCCCTYVSVMQHKCFVRHCCYTETSVGSEIKARPGLKHAFN